VLASEGTRARLTFIQHQVRTQPVPNVLHPLTPAARHTILPPTVTNVLVCYESCYWMMMMMMMMTTTTTMMTTTMMTMTIAATLIYLIKVND
jgi:hypothetical protein